MKVTKAQLKQLIKEELEKTLNEAVIKGPWPGSGEEEEPEREYYGSPAWQQDQDQAAIERGDWSNPQENFPPGYDVERLSADKQWLADRPYEDNPPGYEYEAIQDKLSSVAENAILRAVMEELAPYKEYKQVQNIVQEVKLDIEEAILDALRPLAQRIQSVLDDIHRDEF